MLQQNFHILITHCLSVQPEAEKAGLSVIEVTLGLTLDFPSYNAVLSFTRINYHGYWCWMNNLLQSRFCTGYELKENRSTISWPISSLRKWPAHSQKILLVLKCGSWEKYFREKEFCNPFFDVPKIQISICSSVLHLLNDGHTPCHRLKIQRIEIRHIWNNEIDYNGHMWQNCKNQTSWTTQLLITQSQWGINIPTCNNTFAFHLKTVIVALGCGSFFRTKSRASIKRLRY